MKNYFRPRGQLTTLEQNKVNGKSAERYIAATLTISLNARIFWATRTEDDSKVDLISVLTHPWFENRVEVVFTQVKSGASFCKVENGKLIVTKEKFNNLLLRNHHTLICWTLVDDDTPYWFLIRANSKFFRTEYSTNHLISPASRFDIVRILTSTMTKDGGKGIIFSRKNERQEYDFSEFKALRDNAKVMYNVLKNTEVVNPLFGQIDFTRLGWRHITRESRLNIFKTATYEIMSVIQNLLSKTPTKHFTHNTLRNEDSQNSYRASEYILEYKNVLCFDKETQQTIAVNVYVKLLEFIGYSVKWRANAISSNDVERRVVFKSIYYKKRSS